MRFSFLMDNVLRGGFRAPFFCIYDNIIGKDY